MQASHVSLVFKNAILSKHKYIQAFPVKIRQKCQLKQHFRRLYWSKVVYDFIKVSFRCFVTSYSHRRYSRSQNLPRIIVSHWGPEVWKDQFQFTERSLAACNRYCYRQHYLQSNSKNVRGTSGRDNFKLYDLKSAFCKLESSPKIACQLHLNCTKLLKCHT